MASKIVISDFETGFENDIPAFKLNNDAFSKLQNFYVWRSRVLRKRGTALLGRLRRDLTSFSMPGTITLSNPSPNNVTFGSLFSPAQTNASVIPGNTSNITLVIGAQTLTDTAGSGTFTVSAGNITAATIAYSTGIITLTFAAPAGPLAVTFTGSYYPNLPVMGCESFSPNNPLSSSTPLNYPEPLDFDTVYSYEYNFTTRRFFDVSFYKTTAKRLIWSGQNYQQFWSCQYYNATWVTNGKTGFHFKLITGITNANPGEVTIAGHGLINGDKVWINEVGGMTQINGQTCTVTSTGANTFTIGVDTTAYGVYGAATGIAQYLTSSISGQDGIRWYDGDPVNVGTSVGWVNFAPPLSSSATSIAGFTAAVYYLVGATAILPFRDRLLVFGATIRTSASSQEFYLQDTVIYSQNGTPFYTTVVPINEGAPTDSSAWYNNVGGKGGDISAGINEPILTVGNNEDVLIVGFASRQTRFVYTGNDFLPFLFYSINSEKGADATFASVSLDKSVYNIGPYGFTETKQTNVSRIDLKIPDDVFRIKSKNNGIQRICGVRDFRNEFIYFTVPSPENAYNFPTKTYLYNYLNNTWAVWDENFTSYGQFFDQSDQTWANNNYEKGWSTEATWISGANLERYPNVIGGNQQGFVMIKDPEDVGEGQSQYVATFSYASVTGSNPAKQTITVVSPNHCLTTNDFVNFSSITGVSNVSSNNYEVETITGTDTFTTTHPPTSSESVALTGTYNGLGTYARLVKPSLQTKQFQPFWEQGKRNRIGTSRFLFDRTEEGEVTIELYVSQNAAAPINNQPEFPNVSDSNNSLIFSNIVATAPENNDLNTPGANAQSQIWHRLSTSVVGDSVQLGITLSDDQMKDQYISDEEVALHQMIIDVYPSGTLI